jgi:8-oxo-dGTP pyrophosphatase MutT (NUDIX family)
VNDRSAAVASAAAPGPHPYIRPRDAATLVVIERRAGTPHVLLGRRSAEHAFFPNAFVFPGGRVDRADGAVPAADALPAPLAERLMRRMAGRPSERRARALMLAALRETYEEAGLLIGRPNDGHEPPASPDWRGFFAEGVVPALAPLAFLARAITPPGRIRRFDTRFFAVDSGAVAKSLPLDRRPTQELSELVWLPIEEAKTLPIPRITRAVLDDLATRLDMPGGLKADAPVPYYRQVRKAALREFV